MYSISDDVSISYTHVAFMLISLVSRKRTDALLNICFSDKSGRSDGDVTIRKYTC